jgi:hypothetical protein
VKVAAVVYFRLYQVTMNAPPLAASRRSVKALAWTTLLLL